MMLCVSFMFFRILDSVSSIMLVIYVGISMLCMKVFRNSRVWLVMLV